MTNPEIALWQQRLTAVSNSGVCDGFAIVVCENAKGGTVACYCRTQQQMNALRDLLKTRSGGCDCYAEHTELNGGDQWKVVIIVEN